MFQQIILFGAGIEGREALDFFGAEHVFAFVDNNQKLTGKQVNGKRVLSFTQLQALFSEGNPASDIMFEVVITISNRWDGHAVASQLKSAGIARFSMFCDVKRRWKSGVEFVQRNREIFPCEQESLLKIYSAQFDYLLRHTDPSKLLPAQGDLREIQLNCVDIASEFMKDMERLDIHPFLEAGSLLGAVRHGGFIPWDADLDFGVTSDEFDRIYEYFLSHCGVYRGDAKDLGGWTKVNREQFPDDSASDYIAVIVRDRDIAIKKTVKSSAVASFQEWNSLPRGVTITCFDYFPSTFTDRDYADSVQRFLDQCDRHKRTYSKGGYMRLLVMQENRSLYTERSERLGVSLLKSVSMTGSALHRNRTFSNLIWDTKDILPLQKLTFEGMQLWAPRNADAVLTAYYGKDYMQLPLRVGAYVTNKDAIFDTIY